MNTKDHFSGQAKAYAAYRPHYPESLFLYLSSLCSAHDLAWDAGCGSGQATEALAMYFNKVVGTDISERQLEFAPKRANVQYIACPAEHTPLVQGSADLVTVAQALHWFDVEAFYVEAKRVMKPGALIALWAYPLQRSANDKVNQCLDHFYNDILWKRGYWPPERALIDTGYRTLPFRFKSIDTPEFHMLNDWTKAEFLSYVETWSAVQKYIAEQGYDPVQRHFAKELEQSWPKGHHTLEFKAKLIVRVGRNGPTQEKEL